MGRPRAAQQNSQLVKLNQQLRQQNQQLAERFHRCGVARQRDVSPGPSSRRERPRSGSLPPILSCDHREEGNGTSAAIIDIHGLTMVHSASEAGPWWNHINSVLFYGEAPLSEDLWEWFVLQFAKK